jgi:hypothetical protein
MCKLPPEGDGEGVRLPSSGEETTRWLLSDDWRERTPLGSPPSVPKEPFELSEEDDARANADRCDSSGGALSNSRTRLLTLREAELCLVDLEGRQTHLR